MFLQTLLAAYIIVALGSCTASAVTDNKCQPAEEGQPYQMSYTLTTIPEYRKVLLWYKDGQLMSECPVEAGECSNNDISWIQARVVKKDEAFEFILNIENVTRGESKNAKGVWTLKTHSLEPTAEDMYICVLQVYAKAKDVVCESDLVTEGAIISCTTSRIYPEAMIDIYRDGHKLQAASCESYIISENPLYYKETCKIIIATEYQYVKQNNFNLSINPIIMGFMDRVGLLFGTVKTLTLQNGTASQNQTALFVVTTLLIVVILLIVALCVIYVKKCNPARKALLNSRNHCYNKKTDDKEDSRRSPLDSPTSDIEDRDKPDVEICLLAKESATHLSTKHQPINAESAVQSLQTKEVADKNLAKTTSSILLLGTLNSNKKLFKRTIVQKEYYIKTTKDKIIKQIVDSKNGKTIFKIVKPIFGGLPDISMPDLDIIQLHYTQHGDQVIKLVDGVAFNAFNEEKFIEYTKSCFALSVEGYNAIVVAFTADRAEDCNSMIDILHEDFGLDIKYIIPVVIYETELKAVKGQKEYANVKSICGEKFVYYDIGNNNNRTETLNLFFNKLEHEPTTQHLMISNQHVLNYSKYEDILKKITLLLEIGWKEPQAKQTEATELVDHLENVWKEYQEKQAIIRCKEEYTEKYKKADNKNDPIDKKIGKIKTDVTGQIKIDASIHDDITHLIECLKHIYFNSKPMRRCKNLLMKSIKKSYKNVNTYYVRSIMEDKDKLLDSNFKMRLSKSCQ